MYPINVFLRGSFNSLPAGNSHQILANYSESRDPANTIYIAGIIILISKKAATYKVTKLRDFLKNVA